MKYFFKHRFAKATTLLKRYLSRKVYFNKDLFKIKPGNNLNLNKNTVKAAKEAARDFGLAATGFPGNAIRSIVTGAFFKL